MDHRKYPSIIIYMLVVILFFCATAGANHTMTVLSENAEIDNRICFVIDPGHGGVDGGATSCTGVLESKINLDISLRLNDLSHLLGYKTHMIRTDDRSIHTKGESIAAKKVSDLKERVRIVNETENSVLISIHQNYFQQNQYSGAQVFYAATQESNEMANILQNNIITTINPGSRRRPKAGKGIYLLEHIQRPYDFFEKIIPNIWYFDFFVVPLQSHFNQN